MGLACLLSLNITNNGISHTYIAINMFDIITSQSHLTPQQDPRYKTL